MAMFGVSLIISFPILMVAGLFPGPMLERFLADWTQHRKIFIYMCVGGMIGIAAVVTIAVLGIVFNGLPNFAAAKTLAASGMFLLCGFSYGSLHGLFSALYPPKT
jgi:hypothetical protein